MPEYKVGTDEGEGINLKIEEKRVFISGKWKGRTSKSKKGNWNIAWFSKKLWDQLVNKYLDQDNSEENIRSDEEDIPF